MADYVQAARDLKAWIEAGNRNQKGQTGLKRYGNREQCLPPDGTGPRPGQYYEGYIPFRNALEVNRGKGHSVLNPLLAKGKAKGKGMVKGKGKGVIKGKGKGVIKGKGKGMVKGKGKGKGGGKQYTPPIPEILCVKNVREFVVCGFLMK